MKEEIDWLGLMGPKPITNHPLIKRKVYFSFIEGAANNPFNQSFLHSPKEK